MTIILACDLGSTRFRAALIDEQGSTLQHRTILMPQATEGGGRSEMDPEIWWQAFQACATALLSSAPDAAQRIAAIAISGITRSQVVVGDDFRPIRPAILWNDTRAGETLAALKAHAPADHPETSEINAFHPAARLWWLKAREPATFARARHVLDPKDFLNLCLTGRPASDPVSLARLIAAAKPGPSGASILDHAGLSPALIPDVQVPVSIMGTVTPGLVGALVALAGVPVITMANDTWASVVGLGAMRAGSCYNLTGTTEVLGIVSGTPAAASGLLTVDWGHGLTQLGGPSQCGGDSLAWLLELLGKPAAEDATGVLDLLLGEQRDSAPLLFLPYLQGERVPYWDATLRGAMVGLNRRHRAVDMAHAVMEGVGFLNRVVLERAEAALGEPVAEIRFGGGGSVNPLWCQIKADILGRPIAVVDHDETGLLGAAIVAFTALCRFSDLAAAQDALVRVHHRYQPDAEKRTGYNRLFALFRQAEAALKPISQQLAEYRGTTLA